tara:strand:- start:684 stop:1238 length:555 start_codon:yes stop_codon:yes gene_type:complete
MDDQTQSNQPDLTELQARHESEDPDIDPYDVALLFNQVGSELSKVDSQSVSQSTKSAMQLEKQQVFRGLKSKAPQSQTPQSQTPPPKTPQLPPIPAKVAPTRPMVTAVGADVEKRVAALEKTLKKVESFSNAYQKAKKIKRGVKYNVSSNSMKGEIKDAEVLLEYILCEISKGVKSITIKICED